MCPIDLGRGLRFTASERGATLPLTFRRCLSLFLSYRPATNVADANWYVHPLTHARCAHRRLCRNGTSDHIIVPRRDALFTSLSAPNSSSDAQRPCSTCVRSHAHALTHAPRGAALPEHPECTFDEGTSRIFDRPLAVQRLKPLMK